ncbi:MAG: TIGR01212 family radical SAM protein [Desulfobacterales bacterium]|nr:TIGR01212 family radical SAM protein [Desulfobacterales bacterium]
MEKRYFDFNTYLRSLFGCRVQKISLDAGLSCPNRDGTLSKEGCIYCNAKGSGTGAHSRGLSISEQLENGKTILSRRYKAERFIAYFQSFTNTYATVKTLKALYEEALAIKDVVGLSIGTRPDCITEPVLDLLQAYAEKYLIWIEYGLQSVHDRSLLLINRKHDFHSFEAAVAATRNRGIKICAHVILGLPQEEKKHMLETAKTIAAMEIDGVKLHLLYVVKGTRLEKMYERGEYRTLGQQEYVDLVCDFLEHLPKDMVIQRLTGDPHPDELAAPIWSLDKNRTLALIQERLAKRNTWQGRLAPGSIDA